MHSVFTVGRTSRSPTTLSLNGSNRVHTYVSPLICITTALTTLWTAANARLVSLWLWPEIEFFVLSNRNATLIAYEGEPLPPSSILQIKCSSSKAGDMVARSLRTQSTRKHRKVRRETAVCAFIVWIHWAGVLKLWCHSHQNTQQTRKWNSL